MGLLLTLSQVAFGSERQDAEGGSRTLSIQYGMRLQYVRPTIFFPTSYIGYSMKLVLNDVIEWRLAMCNPHLVVNS